jgi:hypothetical protein
MRPRACPGETSEAEALRVTGPGLPGSASTKFDRRAERFRGRGSESHRPDKRAGVKGREAASGGGGGGGGRGESLIALGRVRKHIVTTSRAGSLMPASSCRLGALGLPPVRARKACVGDFECSLKKLRRARIGQ